MKKVVVFIFILGCLVGIYFKFGDFFKETMIAVYEKRLSIEENKSAVIEELFIYGRNFHIKGVLELDEMNFSKVNLLLYNNEFQSFSLDYEMRAGKLYFWLGDKLNNGLILDQIDRGKYYLFIEIEYSNAKEENLTKYYSLVNQTSYQETEYYTFKTKNNKISISQEESYPTMILEVAKNEAKHAIYDIVIDPGHGGLDGGAINGKYKESTLTYELATLLKQKLEELGFKVRLTHNGNIPLDEVMESYNDNGRAVIPQKVKAKYLFSLHFNSSEAKYVKGLEIYTADLIDYTFANLLASNLIEDTGLSYSNNNSYKVGKGVYTRNFTEKDIQESVQEMKKKERKQYQITPSSNYFYMIRETGGIMTGAYVDDRNSVTVGVNPYVQSNVGVEAYILELGFITNPSDLNNFLNQKEKYATSIAKSIEQFCQLN